MYLKVGLECLNLQEVNNHTQNKLIRKNEIILCKIHLNVAILLKDK